MRTAEITRTTKETDIRIKLNLDGEGKCVVDTGIGFFDHMINSFTRHSLIDMELTCKGDTHVDCHHTIEDCGIVLGEAIDKCLGKKEGINRFGDCIMPMDDSLTMCAIDLSGRAYLGFEADFPTERVGQMDTEMVREFFYALCMNSRMNLHIRQLAGVNSHHMIEGMFKAFAVAFRKSIEKNDRIHGALTTKGVI